MDVRQALAEGRQRLSGRGLARLEAEVLLARVLDVGRAWLYANPESELSRDQAERYRDLLERRGAGEPVAYLTGTREFWSLELEVTPEVLIPRPETELLVEAALALLPPDAACRIADLGTGSGAVAIALAVERPGCEIHATERSAAALAVAERNAARLVPGRIRFHLGSWCEPLDGRFRLIVSNPPYVDAHDPHLARGDCRFEPREALTPDGDALAAIRALASQAMNRLEPGGWLAFEHGYEQGPAARALIKTLGYVEIETRRDLEGRERVTSGRRAAGSVRR